VAAGVLDDQRVREPVGEPQRVAAGHDRVGAAGHVHRRDGDLAAEHSGVLGHGAGEADGRPGAQQLDRPVAGAFPPGEPLVPPPAAAGFTPRAAVRTEQAPSALNLAHAGLGVTLLPGNVIPAAFGGVLRRPDPPVRRPLAAYTRVRPDPVTAVFLDAICHHTLATPAHLHDLMQPPQDR